MRPAGCGRTERGSRGTDRVEVEQDRGRGRVAEAGERTHAHPVEAEIVAGRGIAAENEDVAGIIAGIAAHRHQAVRAAAEAQQAGADVGRGGRSQQGGRDTLRIEPRAQGLHCAVAPRQTGLPGEHARIDQQSGTGRVIRDGSGVRRPGKRERGEENRSGRRRRDAPRDRNRTETPQVYRETR